MPYAAALLFGTAAAVLLPSPVYRAVAVVAPAPGGEKEAMDGGRLAQFAVSRPVLRAAAANLDARGDVAPLPGFPESLGLPRPDGVADRAARLVDELGSATHAAPAGDTLLIGGEAADPVRAARIAQAVADAFLAKRAAAAAGAQRTREAELAARIAAAEAAAAAARKRFLAAGGADAGTERARAAAAADARDAGVRIARIRKMMASGKPPIGDDAAATRGIAELQANYLDLQGKLAEALQTLGERHTTVITLREAIQHAAGELSAAWTRQLHAAEADRDAASARSAALYRNDPGADRGRQAILQEARRAKEAADTALLRAEAELDFLPDQPAYILRTAAAVPSTAAGGWSGPGRAVAAALAACLALALTLLVRSHRRDPERSAAVARGLAARAVSKLHVPPVPANDGAAVGTAGAAAVPSARATPAPASAPAAPVTAAHEAAASDTAAAGMAMPAVWNAPLRTAGAEGQPTAFPAFEPAARDRQIPDAPQPDTAATGLAARFFRAGDGQPDAAAQHPAPAAVAPVALLDAEPAPHGEAWGAPSVLEAAFGALIDELRALVPGGPIPTLMVAAAPGGSEDRHAGLDGAAIGATSTTAVALAIGEFAAGLGLRVLLVEASRGPTSLAAHAEREHRPRFVGMRDGLRLAFSADVVSNLFLAPLFSRHAALAALSRHRRAAMVDDPADAFDLLILDGGAAASAAHAGWTADRYVAIDDEATRESGARFLAALGHPAGSLAGTMVGADFVPPPGGDRLRAGPAFWEQAA